MKRLASGFCFFLSAMLVLLLCGCFSFWTGDDANLVIVWGDAGASRFVSENDLKGYTYTLTLTGPGGTIKEQYDDNSSLSASFTVKPGTWNIILKGYSATTLVVMAIEQVEVLPGQNRELTSSLYTATEVTSWAELTNCIADTTGYNSSNPRIEMIVIKDSFETAGNSAIAITRPVILVADTDVSIKRSSGHSSPFFTIGSSYFNINLLTKGIGDFTLGKDGMAGTLTLDGMQRGNCDSAVRVEHGKFVMNNGITIKNNWGNGNISGSGSGGGVYLAFGGSSIILKTPSFEMNGGTISGNKAGYGGGVSVGGVYGADFFGLAEWLPLTTIGSAGGGCSFTMNGGIISNNEDTYSGGGVYVATGVTFTIPIINLSYHFEKGSFTQKGGSIRGNIPNNVYK